LKGSHPIPLTVQYVLQEWGEKIALLGWYSLCLFLPQNHFGSLDQADPNQQSQSVVQVDLSGKGINH